MRHEGEGGARLELAENDISVSNETEGSPMARMLLIATWALLILIALASPSAGQTKERPLPIDGMTQPERTKTIVPSYPSNAESGSVVFRVTIDPEGHVNAVRVVRAVTGATDAAVAAVAQWEYAPVLLNGEPIWVVTTVSVPSPWSER